MHQKTHHGNKTNMNDTKILTTNTELKLPKRFDERHTFDVANRPTKLQKQKFTSLRIISRVKVKITGHCHCEVVYQPHFLLISKGRFSRWKGGGGGGRENLQSVGY